MVGSKNKLNFEIFKSGIFDNLQTFKELQKRIENTSSFNKRGIEKTKGDILEIFCEALLKTNNEFQVKEVYPQGYVPSKVLKKLNLDNDDDGYDGVYITNDNRYCTYQVKFRTKDQTLKWQGKNGLSSFIAVSEKAKIRHLFANTTKLPKSYERQKRTLSFLLDDFVNLKENDFKKINNFLAKKEVKSIRHIPDKFQDDAVKKIFKELRKTNRATAVMACGTGKTEVGFWVYEKINPKITLVLVPSIALVKQIRASWLSQVDLNNKVMTFQLCSSKDTTKQEDCIKVKQSDLSMEFYDDLKTFKKWLKSNNNCNKIIFSTYQSSKILSKVFNKNYKIDFAIFDEAHRTATQSQKIDSYYSYALEDKNIPIKKRLFMTATRRISNYKRKNKHGEPILSISMDRKELYGNVVVDLSFFEAATKHEAIAIPRLIVSEVFSNEVEQERRKISSTHMGGLKIKSDYLALLIAIKKSIEKYNIKKIFSFHSGVPKAKKFTEGILPDSLGYHLKDFYTSHVSGAMSMRKRDIIMEEFKQNPKSVVSNARCLVEGVNVPAVDMVAFIDNKSSEIDIVQAIGRALRKPRGKNASKKKYGYVLLPLFIERKKNESLAKSIERTNFEKVVLMLKALKEHDSEIAKIISEVLVSESRGKGFSEKSKKELGDIFDTNHPEITKKILINSIHANIIDDLRLKFDEMFGYLKAYHDKFSTYDVSFDNLEFRELRRWISYIRLRYRQKELPNFQVDQLDKINFNWKEPNVTTFSKGNLKSTFDLAKKFKLANQTVIRTLKNIKPLQFYFGSGIMDPIPLYKDYSEKEFAKLMGYDFIDTKDYLTRTQIVSKVKLGIKTVDILIKNKIFKFKGIGPGNIEEDLKFFENFSVKEFKDKLGITILGANEKKGLYTRHNLHTSIFNSKEFPNYGQLPVIKLIDKNKIKPDEIGLARDLKKNKLVKTYFYKKLNKKKFTKISGIDLFNRDGFVTRREFVEKIYDGVRREAYFKMCETEGLIKSVGTGPGSGSKGLSKFYKQLSLNDFKKLKNVDYLEQPKNTYNINEISKLSGLSNKVIAKMIEFKFIKPIATSYGKGSGVFEIFKKEKKDFYLKKYQDYRPYNLAQQKRFKHLLKR